MDKAVRYQLIVRNIVWETTLGELNTHLKFDLIKRLCEKAFDGRVPTLVDYRTVTIGYLLKVFGDGVVEAFEEIMADLTVEDFKEFKLGKLV